MEEPSVVGPFRLSVPSRDNDVLAVTIDGRLFYDKEDQGADDYWFLMPPNTGLYSEGFYLVSEMYRLAMDYKPEYGEGLKATPLALTREHTMWYLTPDSEIYTIDSDGEKRYLWSILDSVYVTPDEHLAERWTAIPKDDIYLPAYPPTPHSTNLLLVIVAVVLLLTIIYLVRKI
jgi:hypothetical protein